MNKSKYISEGAMMIAIIGVILLINMQFGMLLESGLYWVLSFPMMLYTSKYGVKVALIPFVSCIILSFIIAAPTTVFYVFAGTSIGIVYGYGVRNKWSNAKLLASTISFELLVLLLTTFIFANIFGYNLLGDMKELSHVLPGGLNNKQIIIQILLLINVGLALIQGISEHLFAHILLPKFKVEIMPLKPIMNIKMPTISVVIYIVSLFFYIFSLSFSFSSVGNGIIQVIYTFASLLMIGNGVLQVIKYIVSKRMKYMQLQLMICIGIAFIPFVHYIYVVISIVYLVKEKFYEISRRT